VVRDIIPAHEDRGTSYRGDFEGQEVGVVLSGFIGRLDNYGV